VHALRHARPARQRQAPSDVRGAPAARAQVGLVAADRMYGAKRDIVQALGLDIVQVGARPPAPRAAASVCRVPECGRPTALSEGPFWAKHAAGPGSGYCRLYNLCLCLGVRGRACTGAGRGRAQEFPVFRDRMPQQLLAYLRLARLQDANLLAKARSPYPTLARGTLLCLAQGALPDCTLCSSSTGPCVDSTCLYVLARCKGRRGGACGREKRCLVSGHAASRCTRHQAGTLTRVAAAAAGQL
jgi:hypothetical protein